MRFYPKEFTLIVIGCFMSMMCGCAALLIGGGAAVGAGTVAYVRGELKSTEAVSLDRAWDGAQAAMKDLGFKVEESAKDALTAHLESRQADDKKITIQLKRKTDQMTEIRIRVGVFGNESTSRLILEKMKTRF